MKSDFTWNSAQNLIGGMAFGFEKEFGDPQQIITGFAGNDLLYIDYKNNQHNANIPVTTMSPDYKELIDGPEIGKVDVYAMTPICSGLSMLNTSTKCCESARGDPNNRQNQNMYNLTRLAMEHEAKVIAFENAPTLYTKSGQGVCEKLDEIAKHYGYSMHLVKTNTMLHGIGQNRPRTFSMFYRDTNPPLFEYEQLPYKPFFEYCDEVKDDEYSTYCVRNLDDDKFREFLMAYTNTKSLRESILKLREEGFNVRDWGTTYGTACSVSVEKCVEYLESQLTGDPDHDKMYLRYKRLAEHYRVKNGAVFDSSTIFTYRDYINALISKNLGHVVPAHGDVPEHAMTFAEMLHMMGMPRDYHIEDVKKHYTKVTQNVPVCTANYIARQVMKYLKNELPLTNDRFCKQNNTTSTTDYGVEAHTFEAW